MNQIRFDGWTLRQDSGELLRDGRRIRLSPQPFQVLLELVARPGDVLTREHLVATLWPKGVVDFDTALNSVVRRLRTALGDTAETPRYIETVPRRGYRFIGVLDSPSAAPSPVTPPADPTMDVRVRAARPRLQFAAAGVLAGTMLAVSGWFAFESRAGAEVAHAPAGDALAALEAQDPVSADRYRRARFLLQRRGTGDLKRAREYFTNLVALAPTFAPAHAGLASVNFLEAVHGHVDRAAGLERAAVAARRALQLDPSSVEALVRLAAVAKLSGDTAKQQSLLARAWELEPDNVFALGARSTDAARSGHFDAAVVYAQRASAAEPLNLALRYNLAVALFWAGRYEAAQQSLDDLREIDPAYRADLVAQLAIVRGQANDALRVAQSWPDDAAKWHALALAHHAAAHAADADAALNRLIEAYGRADPVRVAEVYAFRGERERAFEWLARAADRAAVQGVPPLQPWMLRLSPFVAPLRDDPRWRQLTQSG
jgi:DNA-binding winged helix-turn-helix (wHTH) protein/tetratricopeptide (TPR) repeat protein